MRDQQSCPLRTSLPKVESSFRTALYCDGASSQSPVEIHSLNCETSGSTHDSFSTSCTDMAAVVDVSATNRMNFLLHYSCIFLLLCLAVRVGQQYSVSLVHTAQ